MVSASSYGWKKVFVNAVKQISIYERNQIDIVLCDFLKKMSDPNIIIFVASIDLRDHIDKYR